MEIPMCTTHIMFIIFLIFTPNCYLSHDDSEESNSKITVWSNFQYFKEKLRIYQLRSLLM